MQQRNYIKLTLLHVGIGLLLAFYPPLSKIYGILIVLTGIYFVVKNQNKNNEVLYVIAYIAGSEVFLRTTFGNPVHEFGKYLMLFFTVLGFVYSGLPKFRNPYWIYLLLLLPAVFLSFLYINDDLRRKISFELLGPICMGILALYNYKRAITSIEIKRILNFLAFPILAYCVFLTLRYSHNFVQVDAYRSNFYFSGEYAPNQMATVLGLGLFIYLFKIVTESDNRKVLVANIIIFCLLSYRGLLTFSRGGIVTALIVVLVFLLSMYISRKGYYKAKRKAALLLFAVTSIFILTAYQTENSLLARYTDMEVFHRFNDIKKRGRYIQIRSDIKNFAENPVLGIGAGKGKEIRKNEYGKNVSTHSELTRMISEHGIFGIFALLILFFYPLQLYFKDLRNYYFLPFFMFWLLTINHSATRIIAPLFLYTLTLLQVKFEKEEPVIARVPTTLST
jgi:hypothetical protein